MAAHVAAFTTLGAANLLAWNSFIAAIPHYIEAFNGTRHDGTFQPVFSTGYMFSNLISLTLITLLSTVLARVLPPKVRVQWGLIINCATFGACAVLPWLDISSDTYFFIILALQATTGVTCSLTNGIFAIASNFPLHATSTVHPAVAITVGQGLSGLGPVAIFLSLKLAGVRASASATVMFSVSLLLTAAALVSLSSVTREGCGYVAIVSSEEEAVAQNQASNSAEGNEEGEASSSVNVLSALSATWPHIVSVFLTFVVTLGIFPSLVTATKPLSHIDPATFLQIAVLIFNLLDIVGKGSPSISWAQVTSGRVALIITIARFGFFALFLSSNLATPVRALPVVFGDIPFSFFVAALAGTSGWMASNLMMSAPFCVDSKDEKVLVSDVMIWSLTCGLFVGSLVSGLIMNALQ